PLTLSSFPTRRSSDLRRASKDAFTSEGKYFFQLRSDEAGGLNLLYLDYASQSAIVLCEKPNCLHNDETCTSFFPLKYGSASSCVDRKSTRLNSSHVSI